MRQKLSNLFFGITSLILWAYVRSLIYVKHWAAKSHSNKLHEPERLPRIYRILLQLHNEVPAIFSESCMDPRFGGIGDLLHEIGIFHKVRLELGIPLMRIYGHRVAGPDMVIHAEGTEREIHRRASTLDDVVPAHAIAFVTTTHRNCAGVPVADHVHEAYTSKLAAYWAQHVDIPVLAYMAEPCWFGWRLRRHSTANCALLDECFVDEGSLPDAA